MHFFAVINGIINPRVLDECSVQSCDTAIRASSWREAYAASMPDELLTPSEPDLLGELLAHLQERLAIFECRLVPHRGGGYNVVDICDGHVVGPPIEDLEAFAEANGVRIS